MSGLLAPGATGGFVRQCLKRLMDRRTTRGTLANVENNRCLLLAETTRRIRQNYKGEAMRACGIIRGKVVELEESPGLPDGQRVEVELLPLTEDPVLAAATRLRARLLQRWKKPLNLSLEFLREDRADDSLRH